MKDNKTPKKHDIDKDTELLTKTMKKTWCDSKSKKVSIGIC